MVYATYGEFAARYATRYTQAEVESHVLPQACQRLEALLAPGFAVPFGAGNLTAKDMALDLAYLLVLQKSKAPSEFGHLAKQMDERVAALLEGRQAMVTSGGGVLFSSLPGRGVWSNTSGCQPVFGLGPEEEERVDPARIQNEGRR